MAGLGLAWGVFAARRRGRSGGPFGPASVTGPPLPGCRGHCRLQLRPRDLRSFYFAAMFVFETFEIAIPLLSLNGQHRMTKGQKGGRLLARFVAADADGGE